MRTIFVAGNIDVAVYLDFCFSFLESTLVVFAFVGIIRFSLQATYQPALIYRTFKLTNAYRTRKYGCLSSCIPPFTREYHKWQNRNKRCSYINQKFQMLQVENRVKQNIITRDHKIQKIKLMKLSKTKLNPTRVLVTSTGISCID